MSDLYNQIVNSRGRLETLIARIPGFRGYLDNKARRQADRMLRDYLAGELKVRIERMSKLERKLLDQGGLRYMSKTRAVKDKWQLFHDRVKAAAPGYSGFFAAEKVGELELQMIYNFDEAQIRYVDRFTEALDQFETAVSQQQELDEAIDHLGATADEANEAFRLREDVIAQIDQTLG